MADYTVTGRSTLDITPFLRSITRMDAALAKAQRNVEKLDRAIDKLGKKSVSVRIAANTKSAEAAITRVEKRLARLQNKTVKVNTVQNVVNRTTTTGAVPMAQNRTDQITVKVNESGAEEAAAAIAQIAGASDGASQAVDRLNNHLDRSRGKSQLLIGAITALGLAAIPVLGAAAGVTAGLIGVLGVGIVGVGAAAAAVVPAAKELTGVMETQAEVTKALASGDWQKIADAYAAQERAMANLMPRGQQTIAMLNNLKESFAEFGETWRGDVFKMFNSGLQMATTLLEKSEPIAGRAVEAFGMFLDRVNHKLDTGAWDDWFNYVEENIGFFVGTWGDAVVNFTDGISEMIMAFDPLSKFVSNGFLGMSESFLRWSQGLETNAGFQKFVDYVTRVGPQVWDTFKSIVNAIIDLGVALAPLGGATLGILKAFAETISAIARTDLGAFVLQMAALGFAVKALTSPLGGTVGILGRFAPAAATGRHAAGGLSTAATTAGGALGLMAGAGRGALAVFGGPWGLALAAAATGVGLLTTQIQKDNQLQQERVTALSDAMTQQRLSNGTNVEAAKTLIDHQARQAELRDGIENTRAAIAAQAAANMNGAGNSRAAAQALGGQATAAHEMGLQLENLQEDYRLAEQETQNYLKTLDPMERAQVEVAAAQMALTAAVDQFSANSPQARAAAEQLATANRNLATFEREVALAAESASDAMIRQAAVAIAGAGSAIALSNAQLQVKDSIARVNELAAEGKQGTDEFAVAQNNAATSMLNAANAAAEKARADAEAAGVTDTAAYATHAFQQELINLANQAGNNTPAEISKLIGSLDSTNSMVGLLEGSFGILGSTITTVPNEKFVKVDSTTPQQIELMRSLGLHVVELPDGSIFVGSNAAEASAAIDAAATKYREAIINVKTVYRTVNAGATNQPDRSWGVGGVWTGGPVKGYDGGGFVTGPGTGTSDSITAMLNGMSPIRLSDGEFVIRAAAVEKYGMGFMRMLNSGMVPKFSEGGPVSIPSGAVRGSDGPSASTALQPVSTERSPLVSIGQVNMQSGESSADLSRELAWTLMHGVPSMGLEGVSSGR